MERSRGDGELAVTLAQMARRKNRRGGPGGGLVLITDPREEDPLRIAAALPRGSWVILRHYGRQDRKTLGRRLAGLCRRRGLKLIVAADAGLAVSLRADGIHLPRWMRGLSASALCWRRRRRGILTASAHDRPELNHARRIGADAAILSPIFPTKSHPGGPSLGAIRAILLARNSTCAVIGLGGMRPDAIAQLPPGVLAGFASVSFR